MITKKARVGGQEITELHTQWRSQNVTVIVRVDGQDVDMSFDEAVLRASNDEQIIDALYPF